MALAHHYVQLADVVAALARRPAHQHVVITGRSAPRGLIDVADTVSNMVSLKHAYEAGIKGQRGIEW